MKQMKMIDKMVRRSSRMLWEEAVDHLPAVNARLKIIEQEHPFKVPLGVVSDATGFTPEEIIRDVHEVPGSIPPSMMRVSRSDMVETKLVTNIYEVSGASPSKSDW